MMETYELRSEISSTGAKYYIQSNLVPAQMAIVTSLFHEGSLLSKQVESYDSQMPEQEVRARVREVHDERKARIAMLLGIRASIQKAADPKAHLKLGEALFKQKLFRESMAEVVSAIKLGQETSHAYALLGRSLVQTSSYEKALKSFRRGIDLSPRFPDLHNDLGVTYLKLERCREAVGAFEKALEINPYYYEALLNMAVALTLNVVLKQDYEMSRDLAPRLQKIMSMCLQLRPSLESEDFRAAMNGVGTENYSLVYEKLTTIRADQESFAEEDLSLELYLILNFRETGLSEEEIDRFVRRTVSAIEANPGYADLQNDLGILYTAKCKMFIDKAHECFQEALKLNPDFKRAEKNLKLAINDQQGIHFLLKALLD